MKGKRGKLIVLGVAILMVVALLIGACARAPEAPPVTPPVTPPVEPPVEPPVTPAPDEPVVDEWVIPSLQSVTGIFAWYGEEEVWTIQQAVKDINAAGGVRGLPMRVDIYEAGETAAQTLAQLGKILDTKPLVIDRASYEAPLTCPMIYDEEVLVINVSASALEHDPYMPWALALIAKDEVVYKPGPIQWIKEHPEIKTVVSLADPVRKTYVMGNEYQREALAEIGVEMLANIEVPETINYGPVAVKALSYNADGYIMTILSDAVAKTVTEMDKRGFKDKEHILIFITADAPELYEVGGEFLNGCYLWNIANPFVDNPRWLRLAEIYKAERPEPGIPSWNVSMSYDAVWLIAEAIENCKITGDPAKLKEERIAIRDYCYNCTFDGVQYPRTIVDGYPEPLVFLFQIQNGEKVFVAKCE